MYDARTNLSLQVVENVKSYLNQNIYKTIIQEMYVWQKHQVMDFQSICMTLVLQEQKVTTFWQKKLSKMEVKINVSKKMGLGRGLNTLIPKAPIVDEEDIEQVKKKVSRSSKTKKKEETKKELTLPIDKIEPNPDQPRNQFDEDTLQELADSIKQYGMLQPILVTPKDDFYEIIAGERRWRAAKAAGLKEVPAVLKEYSRQEAMEISLIENVQRADLNPIEEALAYQQLIREFDLTQEEIAARVAKSRVAITNTMRLLKLDEQIQNMLIQGVITSGTCKGFPFTGGQGTAVKSSKRSSGQKVKCP